MPQSFLGNSRDPYAVARRELARQRILPQVILVVPDEKPEQKFRAFVADWMRMLRVMPVFEGKLPMAPAALGRPGMEAIRCRRPECLRWGLSALRPHA